MKRLFVGVFTCALLLGCSTNPFTGKTTLNYKSNSEIFPMAFQQYEQFLGENEVVTSGKDLEMIRKVGQRISSAAEKWFAANGMPNYLQDYKWEYNLVKSDQLNAWCMPGGKIVFYTGILPICEDETGIAVVMGHEVAHALANHGAQRMSAAEIQQYGALAGNIALAGNSQYLDIFNAAYGIGTNVGGMLPFSRSHENEADVIGLRIMAIAGYDPNAAPELWKRMNAQNGGAEPIEFLSTHPNSATRIQNLQAKVPEAIAEAKQYGVTSFQ
ncbi:M48 family metallopeptidase [Robertkochia solimangrovi]|uniref:M48 family metallopeptidase n=1 Tax=Robertkochia solimangrovi TaxID=2213046 RepID=UPI001180E6E5|nr:M48 family metallopeptidase [Robertkochia solimangrovi]TRZ45170.1 M48 family peptidase [Robertkochia solimangrovi]